MSCGEIQHDEMTKDITVESQQRDSPAKSEIHVADYDVVIQRLPRLIVLKAQNLKIVRPQNGEQNSRIFPECFRTYLAESASLLDACFKHCVIWVFCYCSKVQISFWFGAMRG